MRWLIGILLATTFSPGIVGAQTQPDSTVITNVTIIDVTEAKPQLLMCVLISGDRISQIRPCAAFVVPKDAKVVDGRGKFLIPGLWDMHVHLGNASEGALPMLVASGVTGVRDMGSPSFETLRRWRIEILAGERVGPRIVAAGPILDAGVPDSNRWIVHNEAEARRAVDSLAEIGVDFIKVHEHLDRKTYFAIADEANRLGLAFAGHVPVNPDGDGFAVSGIEASNAGQKSLEHMFGIPFPGDDSIPELMVTLQKNGTWVDPTLRVFWNRVHFRELVAEKDPRLKHVAPALKQFWDGQTNQWTANTKIPEMLLQFRLTGLKTLHDAKIPLLAGTDLGFAYVYPGDLWKELAYLVEGGLTPLESIRTATINPARFLNREKELGSVEQGKLADLVLLEANPLDNIQNLRLVQAVFLNGRFFNRQALDAMQPVY
jgi:Amidohydrolase family